MRNPFRSGPHLEEPVGDYGETKNINKAVEAGHAPVVDVKHPVDSSDGASSVESFTAGAQDGVKKMEATTTVWNKNSLIAAYIMMWIITFVDGMDHSRLQCLPLLICQSDATGHIGHSHHLCDKLFLSTLVDSLHRSRCFLFCLPKHAADMLQVMSSIIGGVLKLPLAKILDIFGRPQGFAIMASFLVVGLVLMAACNNVQTYAAAQIFYWIG